MTANDLCITVRDETRVVSVFGDKSHASHTIVQDETRKATIGLLQQWVKLGKMTERREFELLGTLLYELLFGTEVNAQLETAFQEIRTLPGGRLRVRLSFEDEAAQLAKLPWEYLYYPLSRHGEGFFLATETHLALTRYIPLGIDQEPALLPPGQDSLRILVVVSQPSGLPRILHKPVIEAIAKLGERVPIKLKEFDKPTAGALRQQIEEYQPHVLHFIGHGEYDDARKQGKIALLAEDGSAAWKTDHDVARLMRSLFAPPRLIVLHVPESAGGQFADLAPMLVRLGTPAVVAMQYPITNRAALVFSVGFYEALAKGEPVDDAVQAGRFRIVLDEMENTEAFSSRAFGTPVLYMSSKSGIILVQPDRHEARPEPRPLSLLSPGDEP